MRCLCLLLLLGLGAPAWSQTLVASVEPLAKLMRGLYGDSVTVEVLLRPNQTPHQLALSPRQALQVRQADFLVWLGEAVEAPLAPLVARRSGPSLAMLSLDGLARHHGGHDHENHHDASLDPHLWLSPHNMALLAEKTGELFPPGLKPGQPAALVQSLRDWPAVQRERLGELAGLPWLSYHNPWGYLTEALALQPPVTVARQLDAGPGSRHFVALARQLENRQVQCMVVEPEARERIMARLCPACRRQALDPLGRDRPELAYLPWLDSLVSSLVGCLSGKPPAE